MAERLEPASFCKMVQDFAYARGQRSAFVWPVQEVNVRGVARIVDGEARFLGAWGGIFLEGSPPRG